MLYPGIFSFFFSLLAPLFIAGFAQAQNLAADSIPLCVQTFNAYGPAYASNKTARAEGLIASLGSQPCDIVQFQEVWRAAHYQLLEKGLREFQYSGVQPDSLRGDRALSGLATFTRYPASEIESHLYTVNNVGGFLDWIRGIGKVEKGFSWMRIPSLENLWILNTHTHPSVVEVRIAQMLELVRFVLDKVPLDSPLIMNGDLNAKPDSVELRLLRNVLLFTDAYTAANGEYAKDTCTYCAENPLGWDNENRVIDFVLVRGQGKYSLVPAKATINLKDWQGTTLSDHYGVRAEFQLSPATPVFLAPDSTEFKNRIATAKQTLQEAKEILERNGRRMYRPHIEFATKLIDDLNRLDPGSRLGKFYTQK